MPDVINAFLDLLYQRNYGIEKHAQTDGTEYTDIDIVNKTDNSSADFLTLRAKRVEELEQQWFNLVLYAKGLEDRKTDGQ